MKRIVKLASLMRVLAPDTQARIKLACQAYNLDLDKVEVKRIGGGKVRSEVPEELLATLKDGEQACIHYVSTRHIDRDREIVLPKGLCLDGDTLPPVLEGHDYSKPPIAKDEWIKCDEMGIMAKTIYAPTVRGQEYWQLRKGGFLNSSSIGFIPLEASTPSDASWGPLCKKLVKAWPEFEACMKDVRRIFTKYVLIEHSDVSVPSNMHSVTLAVSKGALSISPEMLTRLEDCDEEPEVIPPPPAPVAPVAKTAPAPETAPETKPEVPPAVTPEPPAKVAVKKNPTIRLLYSPTCRIIPVVRLCVEETVREQVRLKMDLLTGRV